MGRLNGKVAVITGGSGGIGLAAGKLFAEEGAHVLLVDLDEEVLEQAAGEIGDAASYVAADVTQPEQNQRFVQIAVERYGGIDVFFANAGIEGVVKPITEYPIEMFDKVMAVNVRGVWLGLKYVFPVMQERGGSIIITSSVAGISGTPNVAAYVTSKHAVIGLMRSAALEGAPYKIRVNTINPSPINNRMMESLEEGFAPGQGKQMREQFAANIPLGRYGESHEVAQLALFLASDESSFLTGGVYMVDGGMSAK